MAFYTLFMIGAVIWWAGAMLTAWGLGEAFKKAERAAYPPSVKALLVILWPATWVALTLLIAYMLPTRGKKPKAD